MLRKGVTQVPLSEGDGERVAPIFIGRGAPFTALDNRFHAKPRSFDAFADRGQRGGSSRTDASRS